MNVVYFSRVKEFLLGIMPSKRKFQKKNNATRVQSGWRIWKWKNKLLKEFESFKAHT